MIQQLELAIWEALKSRDGQAFSNYVDKDAIMVCGGDRFTGEEYAQFAQHFDCKTYEISNFEIVAKTEELIQVYYIVRTQVEHEENNDLKGLFHVTSTWQKQENQWKMIYNMDSRIMEIEEQQDYSKIYIDKSSHIR